VGELHARDAGADHHEVIGDLGRRIGLPRREHALAVDVHELGYPGT
jgi:hypothetical protein